MSACAMSHRFVIKNSKTNHILVSSACFFKDHWQKETSQHSQQSPTLRSIHIGELFELSPTDKASRGEKTPQISPKQNKKQNNPPGHCSCERRLWGGKGMFWIVFFRRNGSDVEPKLAWEFRGAFWAFWFCKPCGFVRGLFRATKIGKAQERQKTGFSEAKN